MKKKLISFILILAMAITLLPCGTVEAEAATSVTKIVGECEYASDYKTDKDYSLTYYYSDSYFADSAYDENISLATMSMVASLAAGRSNESTTYYKNIKQLWKDCGFSNIAVNSDFRKESTTTSHAMGCASKKIKVDGKTYTLISLVFSGTRIGKEWESTLELGTSGDCQAHRTLADKAASYLKSYISDKEITGNIKVWITGYGAAAGGASLLAADIDDGMSLGSDVKFSLDDIYTYCLISPNTTPKKNGVSDKVYKNIHSYNNPYNVANYFVPEVYSFGRYGTLYEAPSRDTDSSYAEKRDEMLEMLNSIGAMIGFDSETTYKIDDFQEKKISLTGDNYVEDDTDNDWDLGTFLGEFMEGLADACADNRADYVSDFQDDICYLAGFMLGGQSEDWNESLHYMAYELQDSALSIAWDIITSNEDDLSEIIYDAEIDGLKKAGVTDYTKSDIQKFADVFAKIIVKMGGSHPNLSITFVYNFDYIIQGFSPEIMLAWLESEDPNYLSSGKMNIAFCTPGLSTTSYEYTGSAIKPKVTVKNGTETLTSGTDYTVSYKNNTEVGKATITVKGKGDYSGSKTLTFKIVPAQAEISSVSNTSSGIKLKWGKISEAEGYYIYRMTETADSWAKVDTVEGNSTTSWTDTDVTTGKTYKYTIKAYSGSYAGAKASSVKMYRLPKLSLSSVSGSGTSITIKWKSQSAADGYEIYVSKSSSFSSNTKGYNVSSSSKKSATVKSLTKGTTYYVKVRSYKTVNGTKYYSSWSSTKSITL